MRAVWAAYFRVALSKKSGVVINTIANPVPIRPALARNPNHMIRNIG
jgi:hypothetical protein